MMMKRMTSNLPLLQWVTVKKVNTGKRDVADAQIAQTAAHHVGTGIVVHHAGMTISS